MPVEVNVDAARGRPASLPGSPPVPPSMTIPVAPDAPGPRPRKLRALLIGTVIAAALAGFLFLGLDPSSGSNSGSSQVVPIGSMAPNFTLPSLTRGQAVNLDKLGHDRRRPVVLNFFASWCVPCEKETPLLAKTAATQKAQGSPVQFIGVDVADQPDQAVPFVQHAGLDYPIGVDRTAKVASILYGLNGQPQTFFIDGSGHVIGHVIGAVTGPQLDRWLHQLAGSAG